MRKAELKVPQFFYWAGVCFGAMCIVLVLLHGTPYGPAFEKDHSELLSVAAVLTLFSLLLAEFYGSVFSNEDRAKPRAPSKPDASDPR